MRSTHHIAAGLSAALALVGASPAFAWSDVGHKIVCEIAFQELNAKARREVTRLIHRDPEFKVFAESCVWPDHPQQRAEEHFVNVPRDFVAFTAGACPMAPKCLFTGIDSETKVLAHPANDSAKLAALKLVGHWIGDLHQPLHVSFVDDRGGGKILPSGACVLTLHAVWDGCIVEKKLGTDYRSVARDLEETITPSDRATWTATDVHVWANESLDVARSETVGYCVREGKSCVYRHGNPTYDPGEAEKVVVVDEAYLERNAPIVAQRLRQAGVRLGHLLNTALGQ
jgi:nuclease S1